MATDTPTPVAEAALKWLRSHAPEPRDGHEALALAAHAVLLHHDFRSASVTAPATTISSSSAAAQSSSSSSSAAPPSSKPSDTSESKPSSSPTEAAEDVGTLPDGWGGSGYGGRYRHVRSAMTFDIRGIKLGGRFLLHAVAGEDDQRLYTLDVRVETYYSDSNPTATATDTATDTNDVSNSWVDRLRDLNGLATLVTTQIANRLVPDSLKRGYEHDTTEDQQQQNSTATSTPTPVPGPRPQPLPRPLHPLAPAVPGNDPLRVGPPYRDDPLRIGPPRRPTPGMIGHDDLLPPGLPRPGSNDMFTGNLVGPQAFGPLADRGRRPPGVPPGARFDPYAINPDPDAEMLPGFDDDHRMRMPLQGRNPMRPPGRGPGGLDDGPPPGMFF